MALLHRREPVGLVLLGVVLAADPEEASIEQPDGAGEHPFTRHPLELHMVRRDSTHARERPCEREHLVELFLVSPLTPLVVVAVLPPAGDIRADRLNVAVRVGADPDVRPRGGNHELADPAEHLGVLDALACLFEVFEAAAASAARDSRAGAIGSSQSGHRQRSVPRRRAAQPNGWLRLARSSAPPAGAPANAELRDEPGDDALRDGREPEEARHEDLPPTAIQGLEGGVGDLLGRNHEPAGESPGPETRLGEPLGLDRARVHAQDADPARDELGRDVP